ncbi:MAG: ATP-binding cassette domain-containing protein [bacterium]
MRKLASKMRDEVEEAEENKVEVRKDDKTITAFTIPFENYIGPIVSINKVGLMNAEHKVIEYKLPLVIKKNERYMFVGPNGIGKSTLLKRLMMIHQHKENIMKEYKAIIEDKTKDIILKEPDTTHPEEDIAMIHNKVKVGYYSQDFDALDMNMNVRDSLEKIAAEGTSDQDIYRVAAQFLLTKNLLKNSIGSLSE